MGLLKGKVVNHSDVALWVIETTTNHPHGPPIAHKLSGRRKSPKNIDADGFRRFDGRPIDGHKDWWKILDFSSADLYAVGDDLKVYVAYKTKVPDLHFKAYVTDESSDWGDSLKLVTAIYRSRSRAVVGYEIDGLGRIDRQAALAMAESGDLDNVILAKRGSTKYLRTKPHGVNSNNLREIVIA